MNKSLIIANWKCNPLTAKDAETLFDSVKKGIKNTKNVEVIICPPFVYLGSLSGLTMGAQDCFWEEKGPFTGEVSATMLKELGCKYIIVGHSERRKYFNETDETVNKKVKAVLNEKLTPILCVGETEEERKRGEAEKRVKSQITAALKDCSGDFVLAYEPVWAIGTGNSCGIEDARQMSLFIRKVFSETGISSAIKILYGGSVNSANAAGYIKEAGFQGLLVGGASLVAEEFIRLVKNTA
jgi:triosephosphate isomerase